jgi:hypothetical protein
MSHLPDSIRRAAARKQTAREEAVLDNLQCIRTIEDGVPPDLREDLDEYKSSAKRCGLEVRMEVDDADRSTAVYAVVGSEDMVVAYLWYRPFEPEPITLCPTDNLPPRSSATRGTIKPYDLRD